MSSIGYKIFTHDWCSPIQGGNPIITGTPKLPICLPEVNLDKSSSNCSAGWNYCDSIVEAAKIAGYWRTGYPSKIVVVEPVGDIVVRSTKSRTNKLNVIRMATETEIRASMFELVEPWAKLSEALTEEQWLWFTALGRPCHDALKVEHGLRAALEQRTLSSWRLKQFGDARDARDAWDAWDAWGAWDARGAWDAWSARDARGAWDAWGARDAWDAWGARDAWSARDAWDAWGALLVFSTVSCGWLTGYNTDNLTVGLRDAYCNGLALALPTGPNELGWAMTPKVTE